MAVHQEEPGLGGQQWEEVTECGFLTEGEAGRLIEACQLHLKPIVIFEATVNQAEIDKQIHFHDLRHTFASYLVMKRVDLYGMVKLLGHRVPTWHPNIFRQQWMNWCNRVTRHRSARGRMNLHNLSNEVYQPIWGN